MFSIQDINHWEKSLKYIQIEKVILESGIDFQKITKEEAIKFCEENKNILPDRLHNIVAEVIKDFYFSSQHVRNKMPGEGEKCAMST